MFSLNNSRILKKAQVYCEQTIHIIIVSLPASDSQNRKINRVTDIQENRSHPVGDVINDDDADGMSVVRSRDGAKPFLSCRVPELKLYPARESIETF